MSAKRAEIAPDEINIPDPGPPTDSASSLILGGHRHAHRMSCTDACKRPTPTQAHCGVCHLTFGGVRTFDMHRAAGQCRPSADLGFVERDGIWRQPGGDDRASAHAREESSDG